MTTSTVARLLDSSADLKPLAERLESIKRLQRRYRTVAPEGLAEASRVCAIDGTIIVICAASGPVAAALRQIAPRLLSELLGGAGNSGKRKRDQDFTGIRVEVQVAEPARKRTVIAREDLPREKLGRLAERLSDSPLKATLERLSKAPQSRRTRSKT